MDLMARIVRQFIRVIKSAVNNARWGLSVNRPQVSMTLRGAHRNALDRYSGDDPPGVGADPEKKYAFIERKRLENVMDQLSIDYMTAGEYRSDPDSDREWRFDPARDMD